MFKPLIPNTMYETRPLHATYKHWSPQRRVVSSECGRFVHLVESDKFSFTLENFFSVNTLGPVVPNHTSVEDK